MDVDNLLNSLINYCVNKINLDATRTGRLLILLLLCHLRRTGMDISIYYGELEETPNFVERGTTENEKSGPSIEMLILICMQEVLFRVTEHRKTSNNDG